MEWNLPVSISQMEQIEEILQINVRVFDIENLPILNTTQNIYAALMYKSEHTDDHKQCYLIQ